MNSSPSPILDAGQRAWRYWFADGLPTMVAGLCSLSFGFSMLYSRQRAETPLSVAVSLAALGLYGAILLRHREIVEWLKTRVTYPRTGYVRPPFASEYTTPPLTLLALSTRGTDATRQEQAQRVHSDRKRRMVLVLALVLLVGVGMMVVENRWVFSAAGIVIAAALWVARKEHRLSSIVLLGFPFLGFYMTIFLASRVTGADHIAYFLVGGGVLFMLDGAIALVRYIVRNPAAKVPEA
jgi:hypothetical protein